MTVREFNEVCTHSFNILLNETFEIWSLDDEFEEYLDYNIKSIYDEYGNIMVEI